MAAVLETAVVGGVTWAARALGVWRNVSGVLKNNDDGYKAFTRTIKRLIKKSLAEADRLYSNGNGVEDARKRLGAKGRLLSPDANESHLRPVLRDEIYERFIDILDNGQNTPTVEELLEALVPRSGYMQAEEVDILRERLNWNLRKSITYLEGTHRDNAEAKLSVLEEFLEKPDSAVENNVRPSKERGLFHYASDSVGIFGREAELQRLKEFCDDPKKVWWVVTGEGGSGKSKLCYSFARQMEEKGWSICKPSENSRECLERCSESLPNDTLFILDYAESNLTDIPPWILTLRKDQYQGVRIKAILIQRHAEPFEDLSLTRFAEKTGNNTALKETQFASPLQLPRIKDEHQREIINDYAQKREHKKTRMTRDGEDTILRTLEAIDRPKDPSKDPLCRPLYLLVITEAYIQGTKNLDKWEEEDFYKYVYERENRHITDSIKGVCGVADRDLYRIGREIVAVATIVGGTYPEKEMEELLPAQLSELSESGVKKRFLRNEYLFEVSGGRIFCPPLEPDIIGEYFVLRVLKSMGTEARKKDFLKAAWGRIEKTVYFVNRAYRDFAGYEDLAGELGLFRECELPESVTTIADSAFKGCTSLQSITIPESVTYIGGRAFLGCENLQNITIPESVTTIGSSAFAGCTTLQSITIPSSVTEIDLWTFQGCTGLQSITIPESVTEIADHVFEYCTSLQSITIPGSVVSIGNEIFEGCTALQSITIPESVTSIWTDAFFGCPALISLQVDPANKCFMNDAAGALLTKPGDYLVFFPRRDRERAYTVPESVTTIGDWAFQGCTGLQSITIPESVTEINSGAFEGCTGLQSITIPESVIAIYSGAFEGCAALQSITIPESVTYIDYDVFIGCPALISLQVDPANEHYMNDETGALLTKGRAVLWAPPPYRSIENGTTGSLEK